MSLLSADDRAFFDRNGYVKLSNVVPAEQCAAVVDAIWDCLGHDRDDPSTWYDPPAGLDERWDSQPNGFVKLFHHQSQWDNRQHPAVYQAFAELLDEERLWTSIDQAGMKPPSHPEQPAFDRSFIHMDVDLSEVPRPVPKPYGVQGVLYLADTTRDHGGFQCVPSLYREIESWLDARSEAELEHPTLLDPEGDLESSPLDADDIEAIPGERGDLLVWDRLLPHGNGINRADEPRFAQYITMEPARFSDVDTRQARIESWRSQEPYFDHQTPDPRGWEAASCDRAELTPLGRKLLGLDPWPGWSSMDAGFDYPAFT